MSQPLSTEEREILRDAVAAFIGAAAVERLDRLLAERDELAAEVERLRAVLDTPQTGDFLDAVKAEKAHQSRRWGSAHDRSKSAENWFWLVGYLAGKALRAHVGGDREKALHHCVSSAAALANWFDAIKTDESGAGIGQDEDLAAKEPGTP